MKQQLRHLKLFELGIAKWPYKTSYEEMKRIVDDNLNGCEIKTSDKYPGYYFYVKNDKVLMQQDQKKDTLLVRYDGFWSIFRIQFSLEYTDTQAIVKFLVEQHLKSKVGTPFSKPGPPGPPVEQHLKSKVGTPASEFKWNLLPVGTPAGTSGLGKVEQHLKSKVGTPFFSPDGVEQE